jgi:HSP20 family protein
MMLTRYVPRDVGVGALERFNREGGWLDRFFEDFQRPLARRYGWGAETEAWPTVDLREFEGEYVLTADVPGLKREELEIDVASDYVTLKGHHEEAREDKEGDVVCCERGSRLFERTLRVPSEIRTEGVTASLKDGVLTLRLPKAQVTMTRRIEVTEH